MGNSASIMTIDRSSPLPLHSQIEQLFERLIFEQRLAAHEVLPSVAALGEQLNVSPLTVQKAYRHLQERGLIYSIAGKGTFVARMKDQPFVAVLVHDQMLMESRHRPEVPLLLRAVREELIAQGHRPRMLIDMNPRFLYPAPIGAEVMEALRRGRVSGLVLMWHYGSEELFTLAKEWGIPVVGYVSSMPADHVRVWADNDEMLHRSMTHLKSQGAEDVGVMWLDRKNPPARLAEWVRHLQEIVHGHGLKTRLEWLLGVPEANEWASYHAFNHLRDLPERPRGLVMTDEFLGRGALMEARARGLRIPEEMEMAVASYEDSSFKFPGSWSRWEVNLRGCGAKAARLLCERMEGKEVAGEIRLPAVWHEGVEGADEAIAAGFRDGREILAIAAGEAPAARMIETTPADGRPGISKESVR
jgi:GntR family transcriptional regulator